MSALVTSFEVRSKELGESRKVDLIEGLDDDHLSFVEQEWAPRLARCRTEALVAYSALPAAKQTPQAWQDQQAKFGAPDSHWDWRRKKASMLGAAHRMFALLDGPRVEALMHVDLAKASKLVAAPYTPIVYVEYLSVAPWNRAVIQSPCRFNGLGSLMLGIAVSLSIEDGLDGRCGLHSLPQSEGFYFRAKMADLGHDPSYDNLRYFEFSPEAAREFLEL